MAPTPAPLRTIEVKQVLDSICAVTDAWRDGITQTMRLARTIAQARRQLRRGEWSSLWKSERMPFAKRKGEMLVVIGNRLAWVNAQWCAHLPAGWSILYVLARLDRTSIENLIRAGAIHPKLTLNEAEALTAAADKKGRSAARPRISRRLRAIRSWVEESLLLWTPEQRSLVGSELLQLGTLIEEYPPSTDPTLPLSPRKDPHS